jgi:hypothetical protein
MNKHRKQSKKNKAQKGIFLVLFAGMGFALLMLMAYVIATSSLLANQRKLQNTANLISYAALEAYMREDKTANTLEDRIKRSIESADYILRQNKLSFLIGSYENLKVWDGNDLPDTSQIQFGVWFGTKSGACPALAASKTDPLTSCDCSQFSIEASKPGTPFPEAPCFIPYTETEMRIASTKPNAVRVVARTPMKGVSAPMMQLISGTDSQKLSAESIGASVERCTVFLVDVSSSSFSMSHTHLKNDDRWTQPVTYNAAESRYNVVPRYSTDTPGTYAIKAPGSTSAMFDCSDASRPLIDNTQTGTYPNVYPLWDIYDSQVSWCGMPALRPSPACNNPNTINATCRKHYRSDYELENTVDGWIAIDKFRSPQPLTSIMLSVNASLRSLAARKTSLDKVAVIPFSTKAHGPVPPEGLSKNLEFMMDMTDLRRAGTRSFNASTGVWGTTGEIHPNFIDRGWTPIDFRGIGTKPKPGTDLIGAFNEGINRLKNEANCSTQARKTIVIATDGIMNKTNPSDDGLFENGTLDITSQSLLTEAETILATEKKDAAGEVFKSSIIKKLKDADIKVVSMLIGDAVEPNFYNVPKPGGSNFLSTIELAGQGYRGLPNTLLNEYAISDLSHSITTAPSSASDTIKACKGTDIKTGAENRTSAFCTRRLLSYDSSLKYRAPNSFMAQIAIMSQGLFCPISEPYRDSSGYVNSACYQTSCGNDTPYAPAATVRCNEEQNRDWFSQGGGACPRIAGQRQTVSAYGDEMGGQAANCIRLALGAPPYFLAHDEPY